MNYAFQDVFQVFMGCSARRSQSLTCEVQSVYETKMTTKTSRMHLKY
jgi:hypothetical protein